MSDQPRSPLDYATPTPRRRHMTAYILTAFVGFVILAGLLFVIRVASTHIVYQKAASPQTPAPQIVAPATTGPAGTP